MRTLKTGRATGKGRAEQVKTDFVQKIVALQAQVSSAQRKFSLFVISCTLKQMQCSDLPADTAGLFKASHHPGPPQGSGASLCLGFCASWSPLTHRDRQM